jgi:autotransporter-associated beta strand protein
VVNNIVQSDTTIASLTFNNQSADFDTTQIPAGTALTVSGNLSLGANDGASINTVVNFTGGGSLFAGTNGTSTLIGQNGSGQGSASVLDLSGLANFTFNAGAASPAAISFGTGSSGSSITVSLAGVSNLLTASTLNLGNNNTRGTAILNLGNGTNIIYADTINLAFSKASGTMQFLNNAGGGLTIANHTGTGRANIHVSGEANSGGTGTANVGNMLFDGGVVNIMAGTLTVGDRGNRAASSASTGAFGTLAFDNGVVDATIINMATNASGSTPATGTIAVSGTGVLRIGAGGMNMVDQLATQPGIGTLLVTNGGSVFSSNNIYKGTSAGTANIVIADGSLTMASGGGSIGVSNSIPIDNFSITNAVLTLPAASGANVAVVNLNADATTQNTINIPALPSISTFPSQFQLITYQAALGNLDTLVLGTLPLGFGGYLSNNITTLSIDIVITNGPVAKADQWAGTVNNLWDTSTLNWTSGATATNYNDFDFVTFNDQASSGSVTVTGTRIPASLNINNSTLNYTFSGTGKIGGATSLVKDGTGTLTLSESGGDNFTGGIQVNNGTLILDNTNSITGGLTINGGTTLQIGNNDAQGNLPGGTLDNEGTLVFKRSDNVQVGVNIPGGGALAQSGSGRLALSAANAFTGNTTITAGILALTNAGAIANSAGVGITNATLDVSGVTTAASLTALTLSNATLNVKVGYLQTNFTVGSLTMSGPSPNTINVESLPPIAFYPSTNALLQSASPIVGNNFVLGTLPTGSVGTIVLSDDSTTVLLAVTSGPIGVRPTVTWAGVDALAGINTNWSDAQNWQSPGTPVSGERVVFNDNGTSGGSPFDVTGDGKGGIINPGFIDNIVDLNATNAGLTYANGNFHNTLINPGDTLAVNGPFTVNGSGGTATILGTRGTLVMANPGNSSTFNVDAGSAPTLDLSGLDTFTGTLSQLGVGFNSANTGSSVSGTLYLAKTNTITTGGGFSGAGSALVVGGSTSTSSAGTGTLYFGQSNALFVDGIVMGVSHSLNNLMAFNPVVTNDNPKLVLRGITGPSSRVTQWSLGDATINLNNGAQGNGHIADFSGGTLDALVGNLNVGQGSQGNTALANTSFSGMFNMGAGTLDVTTLKIGLSGGGSAGNGIGIMNVTGGNVVANTLAFATTGGGQIGTSGALNLTNATLTVSNNVTIGAGTAGGTLSAISSAIKLLNGASIGDPVTPLTILNLDGGSVQMDVDSGAGTPKIAAATINTNTPTVINIHSFANIGNDPIQIPLITYTTGNDPYAALTLGAVPPGYIIGNGGMLVDNAGALSIDIIVSASTAAGPTTNANITRVTLSGTNLVVHGTNNNVPNTSFHYVVLSSTNISLPLSNWTSVVTNPFNSDGTFDYSSPIVPGVPRQFIEVEAVQ